MYWVDINLAMRKGLKFYQTRSNAIVLHDTLPDLDRTGNPLLEPIERGQPVGPALEVTTRCLQGKYGVEIGIESTN